ncbi:phosphoribosylamine--glycine ligase [Propionibacteriaceae bacterium Y1700]|uniref:phosphoribosylamine--glycine ligase n=1 Tax=Microlunatus sp. Y1700 TaxID=3418487 RepID=UPI003DA7277C
MTQQTPLTVLVIGPGGREHALARALSQDPGVAAVYVAPGNPGTAEVATNHSVDANDPAAVAALAGRLGVDLVVVGPEAPLVAGVADAVREAGIACFGPSKEAARIEGSKAFAKEVMVAAGVPTGGSLLCRTPEELDDALDRFGSPYVVKDDGLAAGKGVLVTEDRGAAVDHGRACGEVVVEEFLAGPEVSLFAITDGTTVLPLQPAQDFKRIGDGDTGPNTGGMGAYTPLPWVSADLVDTVVSTIIQPTVDELRDRGTPFVGLLYAGLAITEDGPKVIEFNARFGDPETQALLPLLATGLGGVLYAAATGHLAEIGPLQWNPGFSVAVVLAAENYPQMPVVGGVITGIEQVADGAHVIQAGTSTDDEGQLVASGGRVLAVVATGEDLTEARNAAYASLAGIDLPQSQHRLDIAQQAASEEN